MDLLSRLVEEGLCLPAACVESFLNESPRDAETAVNLLPWLVTAWSNCPESHVGRRRSARMQRTLHGQLDRGAQLTHGLPGLAGMRLQRWMGDRLIWWPRGRPTGPTVGIVSSRLPRPIESNVDWFATLRGMISNLACGPEILLTAQKTSMADYLVRCTQRYGIDLIKFEVARSGRRWQGWLESCLSRRWEDHSEYSRVWPAILSPASRSSPPSRVVERDCAVVMAAQQLIALRVRPGGNIEQLLRQRFSSSRSGTPQVTLMMGDQLTSRSTAETLRSCGVQLKVGSVALTRRKQHLVETEMSCSEPLTERPPAPLAHVPIVEITPATDVDHVPVLGIPDEFLTHCTRSQSGPWPDEDSKSYLDNLILGQPASDHSALATLERILVSRRLLASGATIRGSRAVCFTAVPLLQLPQLRQYRRHRCRWDFEPYGICIRRDWLANQGTREVRYLDDSDWQDLSEQDRPFFQRRTSGTGQQIDWSAEREWRHAGDLDLRGLPDGAAWVFVPTRVEAEQVCQVSRWPVLVVGEGWNMLK
jgi:hypothetical protein